MTLPLDREALRIYQRANLEAKERHHYSIYPEHLFFGLIQEKPNLGLKVLTTLGITPDFINTQLEAFFLSRTPGENQGSRSFPRSPRAKKVLAFAEEEALNQGWISIGPEHLLLGLVREVESVAGLVLQGLGADIEAVRKEIARQQFAPEAWRTEMVLNLAGKIRDKLDWDLMIELADALEKAGCDDEDLIGDLRIFAKNRIHGPLDWFQKDS